MNRTPFTIAGASPNRAQDGLLAVVVSADGVVFLEKTAPLSESGAVFEARSIERLPGRSPIHRPQLLANRLVALLSKDVGGVLDTQDTHFLSYL